MTKTNYIDIPLDSLKSKIIHEIEPYPTVLHIKCSDGLLLEVTCDVQTSLTPKGFIKAIPKMKVIAYKPKPQENHTLDIFSTPEPPDDEDGE